MLHKACCMLCGRWHSTQPIMCPPLRDARRHSNAAAAGRAQCATLGARPGPPTRRRTRVLLGENWFGCPVKTHARSQVSDLVRARVAGGQQRAMLNLQGGVACTSVATRLAGVAPPREAE